MQETGPNTLILPPSLVESSTGFFGSPMMLITSGLVLIGVTLAFVHHHRRGLDPRELAFRSLSRRMGLTRTEISAIRKHATGMGLGSPVGVILNQELIAQALVD